MNQKEIDRELERQFGLFLSQNLYPKCNIKIKERVTDKDRQLQGIDIILEDGTNIDEKSQLSYINNGLPTFAFELDFINSVGKWNIGWLFNPTLLTESYFICRHIYTNENENREDIYKQIRDKKNIDFKSALVQRLNKDDLYRELIKSDFLDENKLLSYAKLIRSYIDENIKKYNLSNCKISNSELFIYKISNYEKGDRVYIKIPEINEKLGYITYTTYLDERPINLVLRDTFLSRAKLSFIANAE